MEKDDNFSCFKVPTYVLKNHISYLRDIIAAHLFKTVQTSVLYITK